MSIVLVGSTSGSCTLQEQAVAGNTTLTLPTVSGTLITTGSSGQVIPKAALPTGSVLQVVSATTNTQVTSASSTYADTGLTATITPTSSTSKILVLIDHADCYKLTNDTALKVQLLRGSTSLFVMGANVGNTSTTTQNNAGSVSCNYLDSPATTSATTYKTQFASRQNNATVSIGYGTNESTSTITLMEIAA